MKELSPVGWILISCLAVFIIALNISLLAGFRKRKNTPIENNLNHFTQALTKPFKNHEDLVSDLEKELDKIRNQSDQNKP